MSVIEPALLNGIKNALDAGKKLEADNLAKYYNMLITAENDIISRSNDRLKLCDAVRRSEQSRFSCPGGGTSCPDNAKILDSRDQEFTGSSSLTIDAQKEL